MKRKSKIEYTINLPQENTYTISTDVTAITDDTLLASYEPVDWTSDVNINIDKEVLRYSAANVEYEAEVERSTYNFTINEGK